MSVYSRIFASTSKRFASAVSSGRQYPPQIVWGLPGFVGFSWFIWGALTVDIRSSVGLYWDPDAVINRVEAERFQRLEAKEAAKAASKPAEPEDEEEDEEEESVTAEDIEAAVNAAVEQSAEADDEEEDAPEPEAEEEEEEEEEEEKPKKKKVNVDDLSTEEKWEYFNEKAIVPGEDDDDDDDDDDEDDDDE